MGLGNSGIMGGFRSATEGGGGASPCGFDVCAWAL